MTRPIRVLEICPGFAIEGRSGGVGQYVISLSRALNRERVEPVICGLWHYGTRLEDDRLAALRAEGLTAFTATRWADGLSFLNVYTAFQGMQAALQKQPVDIIHSHAEFSDFAALCLKWLGRAPVVMRTLHNHEWKRRPWLRPLARLIYPLAFACEVGISPAVQTSLDSRWLARLGQRRAKQINNAIALTRFSQAEPLDRAALKTSLGLAAQAPVIGTVGRLVEQKGVDILLRAFAALRATLPEACLVLVGSGEQENDFKALAHQLGLTANVVFAGMRPDVPSLLRCLDVFVSASRWEGLPTAIMEAMAAGVPVIGTDIAGTRELIQAGHNGWLVPAEDVAALQQALSYALGHPAEGQRFAAQAKETVRAFAIETVAAQYEALYAALARR